PAFLDRLLVVLRPFLFTLPILLVRLLLRLVLRDLLDRLDELGDVVVEGLRVDHPPLAVQERPEGLQGGQVLLAWLRCVADEDGEHRSNRRAVAKRALDLGPGIILLGPLGALHHRPRPVGADQRDEGGARRASIPKLGEPRDAGPEAARVEEDALLSGP